MRYIFFLALFLAFCYVAKPAVINSGKFHFVYFQKCLIIYGRTVGGTCPTRRTTCLFSCTPQLINNACNSNPPCCQSDTDCKLGQICCPPIGCGCGKYCVNPSSTTNN